MSTLKLRCIIIEDEDDIRNWLVNKLKNYPELEIVGEATTLDDAFALIASAKPDAAFMDIQLIGGDAFTLLNRLQSQGLPIPYIVMATGYPEYVLTALNEYRRYIVQYLLKPFVEDWKTKFRKAIDALMAAKMKDNMSNGASNPDIIKDEKGETGFAFLQNRGNLLRIDFDQISYLEVAGGGETIIVMDSGNQQVDLTLNKFMNLLPNNFCRISRSNLINVNRVITIHKGDRTVEVNCHAKNRSLGISDVYYGDLLSKLPMAKDLIQKSTVSKSPNPIKKTSSNSAANTPSIKKLEAATTLLVRIRNITDLSSAYAPEDLLEQLNETKAIIEAITQKHGLLTLTTISNQYLFLVKKKEDCPALIQAATEINKKITAYSKNLSSNGKLPLEISSSIHTGEVLLNTTATSSEIIGNSMNIHPRIQQCAKTSDICLSTPTWKIIRKEFNCRFSDEIKLENGEEMEVYSLG